MQSTAKFRIFGNVELKNNTIKMCVGKDSFTLNYYNDVANEIAKENLTPDDKVEIWGYIENVKVLGITIKTKYIAVGIMTIDHY
jgi:hypothetical protein